MRMSNLRERPPRPRYAAPAGSQIRLSVSPLSNTGRYDGGLISPRHASPMPRNRRTCGCVPPPPPARSGPLTGRARRASVRSARESVPHPHPEIRQGKTWRLVFGSTLPRGTRRRAAHDTRCPGNVLQSLRSLQAKKAPVQVMARRTILALAAGLLLMLGAAHCPPASHATNNCT